MTCIMIVYENSEKFGTNKAGMGIKIIDFFGIAFLMRIKFILNAIKSRFKGSYDKQNLTLVVISHEIC